MNRPYSAHEFLEVVAMLKWQVGDISLTTDVIVGFPGETEQDFAAHGRDERDAHGRQDGHQGVTLDTGNGKEHGPPPQVVRRGKSRVN